MNIAIPLKERVLAAAAAAPSLTRTQARRLALGLALLSVAFGLLVFHLAGGLVPAEGRPLLLTVRLADGCALASAALTWLVVGRGGRTLARSPSILAQVTLASPLLLFAWLQSFRGDYEPPRAHDDWLCFGLTLVVGVLPLASFLTLRRGVEPDRPGTLGAAAGAMSGGWATVVVVLCCPVAGGLHGVLGHVAPLAALIVAGGLGGARMLGIRERSGGSSVRTPWRSTLRAGPPTRPERLPETDTPLAGLDRTSFPPG